MGLISFSVPWKHPLNDIHEKLVDLFCCTKLVPLKTHYCPDSCSVKYIAWDGCPYSLKDVPVPHRLIVHASGKYNLARLPDACCSGDIPPFPCHETCEPTSQNYPWKGLFA
jgi:hypothetical protein